MEDKLFYTFMFDFCTIRAPMKKRVVVWSLPQFFNVFNIFFLQYNFAKRYTQKQKRFRIDISKREAMGSTCKANYYILPFSLRRWMKLFWRG